MAVYKVTFENNVPTDATLVPGQKSATGYHEWKYADKKKTKKLYNSVFVEAKNENEALGKAAEKIEEIESRKE